MSGDSVAARQEETTLADLLAELQRIRALPERYWTYKDVGAFLQCSEATARRMLCEPGAPAPRVLSTGPKSSITRFFPPEIRAWDVDLGCGDHRPTYLYRHFDSNGILLYVGITVSMRNRQRTHRRHATWASEIDRVESELMPTRSDAVKAEREAIRAERPLYNKAHVIS